MGGIENNVLERPKPVIIKERITRKILRPLYAQFQSLREAIFELVDNAFDKFDGRHGGKHLNITIEMSKGRIIVENFGGKGMGPTELGYWLNWGEPHKTDGIGEYGQGGKAAMGYLGSSWVVRTKKWNAPWLWEVREDSWDDFSCEEKEFTAVPIKKDDKREGIGYCKFEIRNLQKHRQELNRLKSDLSNIYRTYLEEGKAKITVNGGEPINPLPLPLYEKFEIQEFKEKTSQGWWIKGWIGRLKRDVRIHGGPKVIGGMRLLRKGRLIREGEYFGHPTFISKASLGMLIGEVELTKKVPVLPKKTGFDIDSPEWGSVQKVMYEILKPHIESLLKHKDEEAVTREEKKRVSQVRRTMVDALKLLSKYGDSTGQFGGDKGRKRPERRETEQSQEAKAKSEKERQKKEPRTPPPESAVGRLKRLSKMPEWEPRDLTPDIRSEWEEKNGGRCLIINRKFSLSEARGFDELYIAETAALQLARPESEESLTLAQYLDEVNLLMRAFCEVSKP